MKKLFLAAIAVMFLAASCNNKNSAPAANGTSTAETTAPSSSAAIAYVNIDSLIGKYDMYLDLRASYEEKAKKADSELTAKGRSFQNDMRDYQEKIQKGLVTRAQAQTIEESLNNKQQALIQQRDKIMGELAEEEQVLMNQIHYSITEFLKGFNSDYRYSVILSTQSAGPILNADPSLDITTVVLEGLNKKYASEKKPASAADKKAAPAEETK